MGQKDRVAEKLNWWNFANIQYLYITICAQKSNF